MLLSGITNDPKDPSVDTFRSTTLPLLKRFGVPSEGLELKIESRGVAPKGGGEVTLSVPIVHNSLKVNLLVLVLPHLIQIHIFDLSYLIFFLHFTGSYMD